MAQYSQTKIIRVIPVITTPAYAINDQVGGLMTLTQAAPDDKFGTTLHSVQVVDKAKQKAEFDILIFDAAPTVTSVDNGAANITDANAFGKFLGLVTILAADYKDLSGNSWACVKAIGLPCRPADAVDLFALVVTRSTPTYAVGDLEFGFNFLQDSTT